VLSYGHIDNLVIFDEQIANASQIANKHNVTLNQLKRRLFFNKIVKMLISYDILWIRECAEVESSSSAARATASSPSPTTWWYTNARTLTSARSPVISVESAFDVRTTYEITSQSLIIMFIFLCRRLFVYTTFVIIIIKLLSVICK